MCKRGKPLRARPHRLTAPATDVAVPPVGGAHRIVHSPIRYRSARRPVDLPRQQTPWSPLFRQTTTFAPRDASHGPATPPADRPQRPSPIASTAPSAPSNHQNDACISTSEASSRRLSGARPSSASRDQGGAEKPLRAEYPLRRPNHSRTNRSWASSLVDTGVAQRPRSSLDPSPWSLSCA